MTLPELCAAFILVYGTLNRSGSASRIGNPSTYGVQCCRGASDSVSIGTKPENITNVGGSTILIAAKNFSNFAPALIAKYRSTSSATGQGLCRAYIASDTTLGNDEGLYSYDCIANKGTISEINIRSFGTGEFGTCNTTAQLNNYAQITLLSPDCKTVTYTGKTTNGIAKIQKGALVMLHASQKAYAGTDTNPGKFTLAHVLEDTGSTLKLDFPAPNLDPTKYVMQVVSIPQYSSFAQNNSATLKFNGVKGGIFAVAVNGTCDLSGKQILVEAKGGGTAYGKTGAATEPLYVGNTQMKNRLPIGQGHGSVFILAKNLVMNSSTRIGARYSGAQNGGKGFGGTGWDGSYGQWH